ncbi:MAG: ABC transporter permease, partial [Pyrinomonadaceae bacterium]
FYTDAFWIAWKSILEHKLRAFLTLIGIIIGVAAVIVVSASIAGLKTYVIGQVSKVLGSNHFMITRMANVGNLDGDQWEAMNRRHRDVTWDEYLYVKENCKLCTYVGAQSMSGTDLQVGIVEMPSVRIQGMTYELFDIEDKTLIAGRTFSAEEVLRSSPVAVIGYDVAQKFFEFTSPIGKEIKIRGVPMTIIGVEQQRGSFFGQSQDRHAYIPITVFNQIFNRTGGIQIHGKTLDNAIFKESIDEANLLLRNKRQMIGTDESTFSVVNVDEFNSTMDQVTGAIAMVVLPITAIILLVGGIVVMNIMLVSVTERTFEVGLRKALGATRNQILLQFLIESALLCVVGGILGLFLSFGATALVGYLLTMTMTITPFYAILSIAVSSVIGIVAGLYPAWKAARLDPIVALQKV